MKRHIIVWRPRARDDLLALYDWIAERAGTEIAFEYTSRIEAQAEKLATFPERGTSRDDLVPGLRTMVYRRRTVVGYRVMDGIVEILRLVHAGQDWDEVTSDGNLGIE